MKELSNYRKLKYNRFRWWRMYGYKTKPLSSRKNLKDRIRNGDFDPSCYQPQVWLVEHHLNDEYLKCHPDVEKYRYEANMLNTRRLKILEDFEIDERERLETLINCLMKLFKIERDDIYKEVQNCKGEIIDLYYLISKRYKKMKHVTKRGRPKKVH